MPVLSRIQQNDIVRLAQALGLKPSDFEFTSARLGARGLAEVFTHRPTQCRIDFSQEIGGGFVVSWWPQFSLLYGDRFASWGRALEVVHDWMREVKRNDDAPDLWAEARKERELTDAAGQSEEDNRPFNLAEIELLKPKLVEIEAHIESLQPLNEQQKEFVHGRFQYLLGAAKRGLGRIDWLNIFVAQVVQFATEGVLKSSLYGDVMRHAWALLKSAVNLGSNKLLGS